MKKQQVAPEMVLDFIEHTLPFKELGDNTLRELSRQCIIDFFPKDTLIFQQDITEVAYLYIIQQGGVRSFFGNPGPNPSSTYHLSRLHEMSREKVRRQIQF